METTEIFTAATKPCCNCNHPLIVRETWRIITDAERQRLFERTGDSVIASFGSHQILHPSHVKCEKCNWDNGIDPHGQGLRPTGMFICNRCGYDILVESYRNPTRDEAVEHCKQVYGDEWENYIEEDMKTLVFMPPSEVICTRCSAKYQTIKTKPESPKS